MKYLEATSLHFLCYHLWQEQTLTKYIFYKYFWINISINRSKKKQKVSNLSFPPFALLQSTTQSVCILSSRRSPTRWQADIRKTEWKMKEHRLGWCHRVCPLPVLGTINLPFTTEQWSDGESSTLQLPYSTLQTLGVLVLSVWQQSLDPLMIMLFYSVLHWREYLEDTHLQRWGLDWKVLLLFRHQPRLPMVSKEPCLGGRHIPCCLHSWQRTPSTQRSLGKVQK